MNQIREIDPSERYGLTAAQRAYGILWRTLTDNKLVHAARKELLDSLSFEERKAGIEWAVKIFGPVTTNEIVALDMQAGLFPEKSL
jgi:hypothetical protein